MKVLYNILTELVDAQGGAAELRLAPFPRGRLQLIRLKTRRPAPCSMQKLPQTGRTVWATPESHAKSPRYTECSSNRSIRS